MRQPWNPPWTKPGHPPDKYIFALVTVGVTLHVGPAVQLASDLPQGYDKSELFAVDMFLCESIDINTQLNPGDKSAEARAIYKHMVEQAAVNKGNLPTCTYMHTI